MKLENFSVETQYTTIIIGSGASGISAALNFLRNGHENFTIIEALDRIGGRCHSIQQGLYLVLVILSPFKL
jgi:monoamine oxidase